MSTTTDSNRPGGNILGTNNSQKMYTGTKSSTRPQGQGQEGLRIPAGATVQHAENYDEAPPGVPGPDHSSARDTLRKQAKPVFNRGPSMMDFTAVTSAGPTPAGEFPPSGSYFDGSRLRESHLPDEEQEAQQLQGAGEAQATRKMRRQTVTEADSELPRGVLPGDEVRGEDAFAPRTSRQETEGGAARDETSGWTGANDGFGGHT